jgi:RHS repeat-associated protein
VQNASGQLTRYTDADGNQTTYTYDASGNLTEIEVLKPSGSVVEVTVLGYADSTRPNSVTSVLRETSIQGGTGNTTTYQYFGPSGPPNGSGLPTCSASSPTGAPLYGETIETDARGYNTAYCYDTHDRVFQTIDAYGGSTLTSYDDDDDVASTTSPSGAEFDNTPDPGGCGRPMGTTEPTSATGQTPASTSVGYPAPTGPCTAVADYFQSSSEDAQGNVLDYAYDGDQDLTGITVPSLPLGSNSVFSAQYNLSNQCSGQSYTTCDGLANWTEDGDGHQTSYRYYTSGTDAGQLEDVYRPAPLSTLSYTYDAFGRVLTSTDAAGTTTYHYDGLDHVTEVDQPDGTKTTYQYDALGDVLTQTDTTGGTTTDTYNDLGLLRTETTPNATNTYTYDKDNDLSTFADAGGTVTYSYDKLDRVDKVQEPSVAAAITMQHNGDSDVTCLAYPNGLVVKKTYEPSGDLLSSTVLSGTTCGGTGGTSLNRYVYQYNKGTQDTDLRQQLSVNGATPFKYTYDYLDRLSSVADTGAAHYPLNYHYDLAGNLTSKMNPDGTSATFTPNADNEISNGGYAYDADGNLITRPDAGGTTGLNYDERDRVTSINPDASGWLGLTYTGDGQNQPAHIGTASGAQTPAVAVSALGVSSETNASGTTYYTRGPDGTLLGERTPGGNYYYAEDANGSVVAITDSTGRLANSYTYGPWGEGTGSTSCSSPCVPAQNIFGYDEGLEMPGGLYHFGARDYDPTTGRWTQPDPDSEADPIGSASDPTQSNVFAFAADDPVNATDPTGMNAAGVIDEWGDKKVDVCNAYRYSAKGTRGNPFYHDHAFYHQCQILYGRYGHDGWHPNDYRQACQVDGYLLDATGLVGLWKGALSALAAGFSWASGTSLSIAC